MIDSDLPPGSCNSTGHLSTIGYHTMPGRMHHSNSTPAGVDGGTGTLSDSRTPPHTPKKGGKMLAVRVLMLDDSVSMFQIQSKAMGKVLFEQVCRQLHLLEADYFGLEYNDNHGARYWLDVEKPMCRQVGLSLLEPSLRFCVKFYTPDPARLEEEFTRYLFCLQVKRDLAQGHIQCNENTQALMASYIIQAECGDYVPEDYPDHSYLSGYKFFPGQNAEAERRIMENHKKHAGQSPAEADMNLLETARRCELYGIKMHPAKDSEGAPLNLAVAHMGIVVFQHLTKINTFSWAKIRKISFKRKRFLVKFHPEAYGCTRDTVEFFFDSRNECKNFWKRCVENHGFFRCTSVPRIPRHRTRVISRGSSFRYSGRTQKQIVEFVRENYVTRQTFQRSGSFRTGTSLRASRADVTAVTTTLNTSVSAHPLLPLPPGSDAISLEWDKQPHYRQASLIMSGYPPRGRSPVRSVLAPRAYVATRDKQQGPEVVTRAEVNHHPMEDSPLPHRTTRQSDCQENIWMECGGSGGRALTPPPAACTSPPPPPPPAAEEMQSPDEDPTVSSASLLLSPRTEPPTPLESPSDPPDPIGSSTPMPVTVNGVKRLYKNSNCEDVTDNRNNGNIVADSTNSIDVLSAGESDAGDTLTSRKHHNSISSSITQMGREESAERMRRRPHTELYLLSKELLMSERTYKRNLELITVSWSVAVSRLAGEVEGEVVAALGRGCLALEPLALAQGSFLARLDQALPSTNSHNDHDEEYKKIAVLFYDYISSIYDAYITYINRAGILLARLESERRSSTLAAATCLQHEAASPMSLAASLLHPLHTVHRYRDTHADLSPAMDEEKAIMISNMLSRLNELSLQHLSHAENHAHLCQLQRDIVGYDKLLVADREFLRLGCVYKHSAKGLQQRMLFLFTDILIIASKPSSGAQFKALQVLPLHSLEFEPSDMPHSFTLQSNEQAVTLSASSEWEYVCWLCTLELAIREAKENPVEVDTELTSGGSDNGLSTMSQNNANSSGVGQSLTHVCWHRVTSLSCENLHVAMKTQISGYLLRKFKKTLGWQKLWVVFANFTLFFYKSWQDVAPLVSLPLLGYSVGPPNESDGINKEYVFKLHYKNHVYFFRADSQYTYERWVETLQSAMQQQHET